MRLTILCLAVLAIACDSSSAGKAPDAKPAAPAKSVDAKRTDTASKGVVLAPAKTDAAPAAGDHTAKLAEGMKALAVVGADQRGVLAAAVLAEAEVGRLPNELIEALALMQNAPPETRGMIAMKAIATPVVVPSLQALCNGKGVETMSKVAQVAPEEKVDLIWNACGLERIGLVTKAEAQQAAIGELMLALVAHSALAEHGPVSADELALLHAVASARR